VAQADQKEQLQAEIGAGYTIERELGRGGMATVYLAEDTKHHRFVALKVLHAELAASLGPDRFRREIGLAARLQHPHILSVHDSGETATGKLWFTMPYIEGEGLRERIKRSRQLPLEDALRIARDVANALEYAHSHGVIHRDVKPENILLTTQGDALLADFGIARALTSTGETGKDGRDSGLTKSGFAIGTPAYMSPEQAAGERSVDARTDIYSLGAVLYEMLAGEPPFIAATPQAMIAKMMSSSAPSVRVVRAGVPTSVDAAIRKALAASPADRFTGAGEFARELGLTREEPVQAPAESRRRMPTGVALLGLGFLVGVGVLFAWRSRVASGGAEGASGPARIAVLPFDNLGDTADGYFAEGLTDAVRGKLTVVPGMQVTASTSSSQYRHTTKTPQQIGQELGVRYLLVGKVRWARGAGAAAGRVQVSPELIDVTTASDKWQQPFDAQLTDVFQVQADIAGKVAQALKVALTSTTEQAITAKPTDNLAAYDEFLKGEAASQQMGAVSAVALAHAVGFYERAVSLDSMFAPAWAELSRAHSELYANGSVSADHAEAAKHAAERARALAPTRVETALADGDYYGSVDADNNRALAAYTAGLKAAPQNGDLLAATALAERSLGRWDSAVVHYRKAAALDPRSASIGRRMAITYLWLRRFPEASAECKRLLSIAPSNFDGFELGAMASLAQGDLAAARTTFQSLPASVDGDAFFAFVGSFWDLYWVLDDTQQRRLVTLPLDDFGGDRAQRAIVLAQTYALRGNKPAARVYADSSRQLYEAAIREAPDNDGAHAFLGVALALMGRQADAVREGERAVALRPMSADAWAAPYNQHQLARIYLLVGEPEKALDELEPLLKVPYFLTPAWLKIDPNFAPLRGNPRFERLIAGS